MLTNFVLFFLSYIFAFQNNITEGTKKVKSLKLPKNTKKNIQKRKSHFPPLLFFAYTIFFLLFAGILCISCLIQGSHSSKQSKAKLFPFQVYIEEQPTNNLNSAKIFIIKKSFFCIHRCFLGLFMSLILSPSHSVLI